MMRLFFKVMMFVVIFPVFANTPLKESVHGKVTVIRENNTLIKQYVSANKETNYKTAFKRTKDFPTQIVRISGDLSETYTTCDKVISDIEHFYTDVIADDRFFDYSNYILCAFDPQTRLATRFMISGYFDPLTNSAMDYIVDWLDANNGLDFYGTPFIVESARELVVSFRVTTGIKQGELDPNLLVLKSDTVTHYFESHYQMQNEMVSDIKQRFDSFDPDLILSFLETWLYPDASLIYRNLLSQSNFVVVEPERIFLMDDEPMVFSPKLQQAYTHSCFKTRTGTCL